MFTASTVRCNNTTKVTTKVNSSPILTTKPKKPNQIKPKGSGAVPIPETVRTIPGYPEKLKYFKVYCSKFYWARVYINGSYKVRSLKTESAKEASQLTIKFYEDVLVDKRVGSTKSLKSRAFSQVGHNFLETLKGVGKPSRYRDDNSRFNKGLIPHFGEKDIGEITSADVGSLIKKLQIKKLSTATINHYLIVLRKILKYSYDNRLITHIPNFPKIPGKNGSVTKRDYFTQEEYKSLTEAVDDLVKEKRVVRGVPVTVEMKYLIQFMINSFIRPSDLRVLKNEHVQVKTNPNESNPKYNKYLLLSHPATKTTDQEVVTMYSCEPVYKKQLEFQKKAGYGKKGDYVFFPNYPNRDTMMSVIGRLFREVVKKANLKNDEEQHTLYSLRHSAIMYRLLLGNVNTLQLAKNARTSQAMIEKFYSSRLTNVMGVDELHSFKSLK